MGFYSHHAIPYQLSLFLSEALYPWAFPAIGSDFLILGSFGPFREAALLLHFMFALASLF
jgi:hypothetical protein